MPVHLQSLGQRGFGGLATLLGEAAEPLRKRDYHALRTLSGVAPVTRRSGTPRRPHVSSLPLRRAHRCLSLGRVAIQHDARSRARYADSRKRGHSHGRACAVSPTASSPSPVPCSKPKPPSTQNMPSRLPLPDLRPIPWFDRDDHPFVPTCRPAERRAQWKSPRRGRSEAEHRALARLTERARRYTPNTRDRAAALRGHSPAKHLTTGGSPPRLCPYVRDDKCDGQPDSPAPGESITLSFFLRAPC